MATFGKLAATIAKATAPIMRRVVGDLGTELRVYRGVSTLRADNSERTEWSTLAGASSIGGMIVDIKESSDPKGWASDPRVEAVAILPIAPLLHAGDGILVLGSSAAIASGTAYLVTESAPIELGSLQEVGIYATPATTFVRAPGAV